VLPARQAVLARARQAVAGRLVARRWSRAADSPWTAPHAQRAAAWRRRCSQARAWLLKARLAAGAAAAGVLAAAAAAVYRRLKDRQVRPVPPRAQAAG